MKKHHCTLRTALFVLGSTIALMSLMPILAYEGLSYSGYEVAFGKELIDVNPFDLGSIASAHLPFSIAATLAFLLPLLAGLMVLLSKRLAAVSFVALIAALILFARLPETVEILTIIAGNENTVSVDWSVAEGLYIAIALSGLALVVSGTLTFLEKNM